MYLSILTILYILSLPYMSHLYASYIRCLDALPYDPPLGALAFWHCGTVTKVPDQIYNLVGEW